MTKTILSIGSNVANRRDNLVRALALLGDVCTVLYKSKIYETPPVGFTEQRDFLNAAVAAETECDAFELLRFCKQIELSMGRTKPFPNAPRTIDLDIVFYGGETIETPELVVPHPRWSERDFVKTPLLDLLESNFLSEDFFCDVRKELEKTSRAFPPFASF